MRNPNPSGLIVMSAKQVAAGRRLDPHELPTTWKSPFEVAIDRMLARTVLLLVIVRRWLALAVPRRRSPNPIAVADRRIVGFGGPTARAWSATTPPPCESLATIVSVPLKSPALGVENRSVTVQVEPLPSVDGQSWVAWNGGLAGMDELRTNVLPLLDNCTVWGIGGAPPVYAPKTTLPGSWDRPRG